MVGGFVALFVDIWITYRGIARERTPTTFKRSPPQTANSSRFLPCASNSVIQRAGRPRPLQIWPSGPRYFTPGDAVLPAAFFATGRGGAPPPGTARFSKSVMDIPRPAARAVTSSIKVLRSPSVVRSSICSQDSMTLRKDDTENPSRAVSTLSSSDGAAAILAAAFFGAALTLFLCGTGRPRFAISIPTGFLWGEYTKRDDL